LVLVNGGVTRKCDCGSVPSIDRNHCGGKIDEFLFREMSARFIIDLILHVMVANLRHRDQGTQDQAGRSKRLIARRDKPTRVADFGRSRTI
jgi:hypothetical protein